MNDNLKVVLASGLSFLILVLSNVVQDILGAAIVGAGLTMAVLVHAKVHRNTQ